MNRISDISTNIGSGMTPSRRNKDFWNSNDIMWLKSEQLGDFTIENTNEYISNIALEKTKIKLWEKGTISIAMYGEGKTRGKVSILDNKMATNQAICNIEIDKTKADNFFLYYWLVLNYKSLRNISNGVRNNLNTDDIRNFSFPNINLLEQKKISNTLLLLDKKIKLNNKINDNLEKQMKLLYENLMSKINSGRIKGKYLEVKDLVTVITGKEDANFSTPSGQYKFFTCSNVPLQCDEYKFDQSSILIAGNGDFNIKHYTGKFNAYQRTYVLSPDKKYYAILYLSSLYRINSFKSKSTGSIVKFITKEDIECIPVFIPENRAFLSSLNKMLNLKEKYSSENEGLIKIRNFLLPMLMNGQATVSD